MFACHRSPYAGRWYPSDVRDLRSLLASADATSAERLSAPLTSSGFGFIVPHAAPEWSGTVASAAYRALAAVQPARVVVLAFPHRGGLKGVALSDAAAIETPLGEVPLDREWTSRLAFPTLEESRLCDHSFEIQLPYLQHHVPGARVAALYVGPLTSETRLEAAVALAQAWEPGTVFIASSDLTHFGREFGYLPFPANDSTPARLRELDHEVLDEFAGIEADRALAALARTGATVCGREPVALLLETLARLPGGAPYQVELDYQRSADLNDEWRHTVSYGALGYYGAEAFTVDRESGAALLDAAESALANLRATGRRNESAVRGDWPALARKQAVFVTLRRGEELRGCIGDFPCHDPLSRAVPRLTLAAALDDPRFNHAAIEPDIDVEISLLTPPRPIRNASQFEPGRHGAVLYCGRRRALLLPQVARERNWDAPQFLTALARKAGLPAEAWRKPDVRLSVFEAQVLARA